VRRATRVHLQAPILPSRLVLSIAISAATRVCYEIWSRLQKELPSLVRELVTRWQAREVCMNTTRWSPDELYPDRYRLHEFCPELHTIHEILLSRTIHTSRSWLSRFLVWSRWIAEEERNGRSQGLGLADYLIQCLFSRSVRSANRHCRLGVV